MKGVSDFVTVMKNYCVVLPVLLTFKKSKPGTCNINNVIIRILVRLRLKLYEYLMQFSCFLSFIFV